MRETDVVQDLRRALWRAGPGGATSRTLAQRCRSFRELPLTERRAVLQRMVEDRQCITRRAPRTVLFIDRDFVATPRA